MTNKTTLRERIRALEVKVANLCQRLTDLYQKFTIFENYVKEQFENHLREIKNEEKEHRAGRHDWLICIIGGIIVLLQAVMVALLVKR